MVLSLAHEESCPGPSSSHASDADTINQATEGYRYICYEESRSALCTCTARAWIPVEDVSVLAWFIWPFLFLFSFTLNGSSMWTHESVGHPGPPSVVLLLLSCIFMHFYHLFIIANKSSSTDNFNFFREGFIDRSMNPCSETHIDTWGQWEHSPSTVGSLSHGAWWAVKG